MILTATLIYTFTRTPVYESTATVQIFRRNPTVMQVQQVMDNEVRSAEDLNTQVNILRSTTIVDGVAKRLTPEQQARLVAPFATNEDTAAAHSERGRIASMTVASGPSLTILRRNSVADPQDCPLAILSPF